MGPLAQSTQGVIRKNCCELRDSFPERILYIPVFASKIAGRRINVKTSWFLAGNLTLGRKQKSKSFFSILLCINMTKHFRSNIWYVICYKLLNIMKHSRFYCNLYIVIAMYNIRLVVMLKMYNRIGTSMQYK